MINKAEKSPEIRLPQWYACLAPSSQDIASRQPRSRGSKRYGPITVFNDDAYLDAILFGDGGRNVAIFEGFILDEKNLCNEFEVEADTLNGAHYLALAYQRWGQNVFDHLTGGYLAAIWDEHNGVFLMGHDESSKHPVYYAQHEGLLWFASNVLSLAHADVVPRQPNMLSLYRRLLLYWPRATETFFKNISRLRPGHYLVQKIGGSLREIKYWQPYLDDDEPFLSEQQALEEFDAVLEQAVARALKLNPQGILLSGGTDSVSVAVLAKRLTDRQGLPPLVACSGQNPVGYSRSYEEVFQPIVAQGLGMQHIVQDSLESLNGQDMLRMTMKEVPLLPAPTTIYWSSVYMGFYRYLTENNLNVFLTGSGGDEWLGVHDAIAADYVGKMAVAPLRHMIDTWRTMYGLSYIRASKQIIWEDGIRRRLASIKSLLFPAATQKQIRARIRNTFPDWLTVPQEILPELIESIQDQYIPALDRNGAIPRSYYRHAIYEGYKNPYMYYEFERRFHFTSAIGVRLLSPFHDRTVVDFFKRVSPQTLLYAQRTKGLLRLIVNESLPDTGLDKQAKVYDNYGEAFVNQAIVAELPDLVNRSEMQLVGQLGLIGISEFAERIVDFDQLGRAEMVELFTVASMEAWLRENI